MNAPPGQKDDPAINPSLRLRSIPRAISLPPSPLNLRARARQSIPSPRTPPSISAPSPRSCSCRCSIVAGDHSTSEPARRHAGRRRRNSRSPGQQDDVQGRRRGSKDTPTSASPLPRLLPRPCVRRRHHRHGREERGRAAAASPAPRRFVYLGQRCEREERRRRRTVARISSSLPAPWPLRSLPTPRTRGARMRRRLLFPADVADARSDDASAPASPSPLVCGDYCKQGRPCGRAARATAQGPPVLIGLQFSSTITHIAK